MGFLEHQLDKKTGNEMEAGVTWAYMAALWGYMQWKIIWTSKWEMKGKLGACRDVKGLGLRVYWLVVVDGSLASSRYTVLDNAVVPVSFQGTTSKSCARTFWSLFSSCMLGC